MLRIAVQSKGRLFDETMSLFAETGIKIENGKRLLLLSAKNFPLEALFLRDDDIPRSVAEGIADVGIVGENECSEKEQNVIIVKRLGFSACRLSLAVPKETDYTGFDWFNGKVIATSYPKILEKTLAENNIKANIRVITGSVEIAPNIGFADAIFDIVSSGSTLVTNHLKEVETLMKSEALLIRNPELSDEKIQILNDFIFRVEAVKMAENKKYVLMNVPSEKLKEIIEVLPGIKSPTIMPLAKEGWNSLHVVIDERSLWDIIGKLKMLGAEGILVVPIEKIIP
jgi:ATP phosphoribosyltransferase